MPYYELCKEAMELLREDWTPRVGNLLCKWHLYNRHCTRCGRGPIGHDVEPALCDDCHHNHEHGGEG